MCNNIPDTRLPRHWINVLTIIVVIGTEWEKKKQKPKKEYAKWFLNVVDARATENSARCMFSYNNRQVFTRSLTSFVIFTFGSYKHLP